MIEFWEQHGYAWIVLPSLIFLARILDVSIATMRLLFLARGARMQTVILGFFEALIWIIIISQVIRNLDNMMCFFAYAAGFATGSYIGMRIEERLALGKIVMRIITQKPADELVNALRKNRHGVTHMPAEGANGPVRVLFMVIERANLEQVVELVKKFNPNAFYTVEDVRYVSEGVFPLAPVTSRPALRWPGLWRTRQK